MTSTIPRTTPQPPPDTMSERAAMLVEQDILRGKLQPGQRLGITDLAKRYGIGATPLREGLSRLVSRGLIVAIGQRGFRVTEISQADLVDITLMRSAVEMQALRLSIANGNDAWEAEVLAALHRLRRYLERAGEDFREGTAEFDRLHKDFHSALLAACGSTRLMLAHSDLYDQAYRYRQLMISKFGSSEHFMTVHENLANLVLARKFEKASLMLEEHLQSTLRYVYPEAGTAT